MKNNNSKNDKGPFLRWSLTVLIGFFSVTPSLACDICGCGVGSYYVGILPEFNKKLVGLRYRYNQLTTHLGAGGVSTYLTTKERFHTIEVWGGWNIGEKFRVMASLPTSTIVKENQEASFNKIGVGDPIVQGFFRVMKKSAAFGKTSPKLVNQSLWIGAGIKAPLGQYNDAEKNNTAITANTFQLGTGSTDFLFNAIYDLRIQDDGINLNASYKINTSNRYDFKYGNRLNLTAQYYHKFSLGKSSRIAPNAGMVWEYANKDVDKKFLLPASGGRLLMGAVGVEYSNKRLTLGANFQSPFSQKIANGFVRAESRAMLHLAFLL